MFWIISALLILISFAFFLPPMLRKQHSDGGARRSQNILIANEQLAELENNFERGDVAQEEYQNTRNELELTLFSDVADDDSHLDDKSTKAPILSIIAVLVFIPLLSVWLYQELGNPVYTTSFDSKKIAAEVNKKMPVPRNADGTPDIDTMVIGLQKKLEANPKNAKGWYMLGRSYMVLKRYADATKAYEKTYQLKPKSVDVMLSLADSLAMQNKGDVSGRSVELINKALEIDPDNLTALWLGGMAARQKEEHVVAIQRWSKVLGIVKDPSERQEVISLIKEAEKQLSPEQRQVVKTELASLTTPKVAPKKTEVLQTPAKTIADTKKAATTEKSITVSVSLSDAFKDKVTPTDVVFVYAKAMSGPPMPLAAAKIQVKDLPVEIILNDSMAMMPSMKLSAYSEVVIGARVSKSGQPVSKAGDLYAEKRSVQIMSKVDLIINEVKE